MSLSNILLQSFKSSTICIWNHRNGFLFFQRTHVKVNPSSLSRLQSLYSFPFLIYSDLICLQQWERLACWESRMIVSVLQQQYFKAYVPCGHKGFSQFVLAEVRSNWSGVYILGNPPSSGVTQWIASHTLEITQTCPSTVCIPAKPTALAMWGRLCARFNTRERRREQLDWFFSSTVTLIRVFAAHTVVLYFLLLSVCCEWDDIVSILKILWAHLIKSHVAHFKVRMKKVLIETKTSLKKRR